MMKEIWVSDALPYRTCQDWQAREDLWFIGYNLNYCAAPRQYGESAYDGLGLQGLCVVPKKTATSDYVLWVQAQTNIIAWPSWGAIAWELDGTTGEFIRWIPSIVNIIQASSWFKIQRNGTIWTYYPDANVIGLGTRTLAEYVLKGDTAVRGTRAYPISHFPYPGSTRGYPFDCWDGKFIAIDDIDDIAVLHSDSTPDNCVSVHRLSTGQWLRDLGVPGTPIQADIEFNHRVFVLCSNGNVALVDYDTGRTYSVNRLPIPAAPGRHLMTYDYVKKRLLQTWLTPDAVDGASTIQVHGYLNVPVPSGLTCPVPLKKPRQGVRVPYVARVFGDAGEPVPSIAVQAAITGAPTQLPTPYATTDMTGYATFNVEARDVGDQTLTLTADLP